MSNYSITLIDKDGMLYGTDWYLKRNFVEGAMLDKINSLGLKISDIKSVKLFVFRKGGTLDTMKKLDITNSFKRKYRSYLNAQYK